MPDETTKKPTRRVKPLQPSRAEEEIDRRLAEAIIQRADALEKINQLSYHQNRLAQLEREIESLIGYKQRLIGQTPTPLPPPLTPRVSDVRFDHTAPISPNVGSIPARQPKPTTPNVAVDIANEGGFS